MKIIAFSNPTIVSNELATIQQLFENGLDELVIRKPGLGIKEIIEYVEGIDVSFYNKLTICDYPNIVLQYRLGGLHCSNSYYDAMVRTERNQMHQLLKESGQCVSISAHNPREWQKRKGKFDQLYLCPIFPSISKPGYSGDWEIDDITKELSQEQSATMIALGGIEMSRLEEVKEIGFEGIGVLGGIWKEQGEELNSLKALQTEINRISPKMKKND